MRKKMQDKETSSWHTLDGPNPRQHDHADPRLPNHRVRDRERVRNYSLPCLTQSRYNPNPYMRRVNRCETYL